MARGSTCGARSITRGEIFESYITKARDKAAALRFMKKALKRHGSPALEPYCQIRPVEPKTISPVDPAARWTAQRGGPAEFCYATNYLIDVEHGVIVDVEATTAVRQAEVTAAKRMIERTHDRFGLWPERLAADTGYGSAEMLAWLVHEKGIEPHVPVFDKSGRTDGTFSRDEFRYDARRDIYLCPGGTPMRTTGTLVNDGATLIYRASKHDCRTCALKPRCCPKQPQRQVTRSIHEGARDLARDLSKTDAWLVSRRERKKVEMLFAHLKRILKLDRLRLRGPCGARDEFYLAAAAQNTSAKWPS